MYKDPLVASNYAKALLHVVKKSESELRAVLQETKELRQLILAESRLRVFLEGPQFREENKVQLVTNVFRGKLSDILFQFLLLLLHRNRIDNLFDIFDIFEWLVEHEEGITPGTVYTAVSLTEEEQRQLRDKLEVSFGLKFDLRYKIDPNLIGGVKVQYKDILIDSTIQSYLGDIRQRLMKTRLAS